MFKGIKKFILQLARNSLERTGASTEDFDNTFGSIDSASAKSFDNFTSSFRDGISNWWKGFTGSGVTQRDIELNQMNMQNVEDQASREVAGYTKAGVNPALMYGSGMGSSPSASSSGAVGNMSELMRLMTLPAELKNLASQSKLNRDQGKALLLNAEANKENADTNKGNLAVNERNAGVNERNAGVNEMRADIEAKRQEVDAYVAKYNLKLTDAQVDKLASDAAYINKQTDQLDERLEIAKRQAKASETSALASLKSALAQTRQVAINEKLAPFQQDLLEAQSYVEWANGEGKDIVNRYLDENQLKNLQMLGEQLREISAHRKLYDAQTVHNYVNCATDVVNSIANLFNAIL